MKRGLKKRVEKTEHWSVEAWRDEGPGPERVQLEALPLWIGGKLTLYGFDAEDLRVIADNLDDYEAVGL